MVFVNFCPGLRHDRQAASDAADVCCRDMTDVSVQTGQMSAVETGKMTAAETSVLSQQKASVLSQQCPRLYIYVRLTSPTGKMGVVGCGRLGCAGLDSFFLTYPLVCAICGHHYTRTLFTQKLDFDAISRESGFFSERNV